MNLQDRTGAGDARKDRKIRAAFGGRTSSEPCCPRDAIDPRRAPSWIVIFNSILCLTSSQRIVHLTFTSCTRAGFALRPTCHGSNSARGGFALRPPCRAGDDAVSATPVRVAFVAQSSLLPRGSKGTCVAPGSLCRRAAGASPLAGKSSEPSLGPARARPERRRSPTRRSPTRRPFGPHLGTGRRRRPASEF